MFTLIKLTFNCFSMFICRALTLRWLCGWKLLELQFVAEQITSLHFLDSLNSSRLVGRVMFFRNVTASAFGSTYLICEVTKVDYFKLVKKCLQGQCPQYFKEYFKRNNTIYARTTSWSNLLHPPAVKTEVAKRSFCYYGCTLFNELSWWYIYF